ncbi:MAG: excinuclease ABC subunit UvrB [Bacteroidales bacterium]|nr:excinuclease ABC subunit UvrB [Bacteroidales bacterium]
MDFKLTSSYQPSGDQPTAIQQLVDGLNRGDEAQTLLGVTGSGKTFTIANVLQRVNRPALVLSHNKTLAAQLYGEFKQFFPENAVEYYVSYYDYYQPEAYIPTTNTYIEKDLAINDEIEKLRLHTTASLLSGRRDVIVVASVSCIYGVGNPNDFAKNVINLHTGMRIDRNQLLLAFVSALYSRTELDLQPSQFRVKGDTVDIFPPYGEIAYRILFFDDEIESIAEIEAVSGGVISRIDKLTIYPASIFVTTQQSMNDAIVNIKLDLGEQIEYLKSIGKHLEAKRLDDRVNYDVEMMRELGYCSGIENYSRYFDKRQPGERPFCILDFFPDDFVLIVDESHVTVPQIGAMYGGDRSRKINLVEYGFRLPAALDNRPLKFDEFESLIGQTIYMSATPAEFELKKSGGVVVEQVVRPTGLLDPPIEVRPATNQVDDLLNEIEDTVDKHERVLVTTLTKRMAEELNTYLINIGIKSCYIHSDVETLDRVEILKDLRAGAIDVLVGVNLLREGLDLPEVSLVAVMDADKEGFLRNERSLTQTAGRAARHVNGRVIFYANKITKSMRATMDETARRRAKQMAYNEKHHIIPRGVVKSDEMAFPASIDDAVTRAGERWDKPNSAPTTRVSKGAGDSPAYSGRNSSAKPYTVSESTTPVAAEAHLRLSQQEGDVRLLNLEQLKARQKTFRKAMDKAVKALDFDAAASLRDELLEIERRIKNY